MKKRLKIFFLLILLISIILSVSVKADSGFDGSYDSGGSYSSGSDWGSDWSSSSSYGSGSSYHSSSSSSGDLGELFIFVIFIIFVILVYSNVNSNPSENIKEKIIPYDINKIREVFPEFDKEQFKNYTYDVYKKIQVAWMDFDYETLRKYTTDELYNMYNSQLTTLSVKNQKNIMKEFELKDFEIVGMEINDKSISLTTRMIISCFDYIVDNDNKTIRGKDYQKVTYDYRMTFIKGLDEKQNKCPNCNAPLENVNSSQCPYCDSVIISDNHDWILSKKTVISQTENKK